MNLRATVPATRFIRAGHGRRSARPGSGGGAVVASPAGVLILHRFASRIRGYRPSGRKA